MTTAGRLGASYNALEPERSDLFCQPSGVYGRTHGKVRRSKTGLVGSWATSTFNVTDEGFGYSCLTDVAEKGKLGLLWEGRGGIVFSSVPLDF